MTTRAIQFTQEQARALTGITPGDLRHWRKAVPYLSSKAGKSARFTFADLVGLGAVAELVRTYGVHIADVASGIDMLFRKLGNARPTQLEGLVALVTAQDAHLFQADELVGRHVVAPALVVPCDPLIVRMRTGVLPIDSSPEQSSLLFPPQILKAGK